MKRVRNANSPAIAGDVRRNIHHVGRGSIHRSDALNITQIFLTSNFCSNGVVDR